MKNADPGLDLELMIDAADRARYFVDGLTEQDFLADYKTQDAVAMCLVVIGESAKLLMRDKRPVVHGVDNATLADMIEMRERLAPGDGTLNRAVIWETVRDDLKPLIDTLQPILAALPDPDAAMRD